MPSVSGSVRSIRRREILLTDAIGVMSPSSFEREATAAWVRSLGYAAEAVEPYDLRTRRTLPRILLAHGAESVNAAEPAVLARMGVIVLVDGPHSGPVLGAARLVQNGGNAGTEIRAVLGRMLGTPSIEPVTVSSREQEVLATYVLGDTVRETATHHHIAESTVRTHYRRVARRYEAAGRPIANKAQLLLAMVSDGWLRLDGSLGVRADE
ncbi:helix-turn-helix transcriptional regulator [Gordonia phthalatica]|uniref:helix-turn-helix transcriptional regulator n=1 Tax=Gordonia phthalatica TaxID=1136941 RepID=UPI001D052BA7|nr:LuxR C-terminal-related transcriptional regulator [Gordonia phthalatica]